MRRAICGALAGVIAGALAGATCSAVATARDAGRVQSLAVGASPALAACEGLDARNSYEARVAFPRTPRVRRRLRLAFGVGQAPSSDADGNLLVAHGEARISKLDVRGESVWSVRLPSEASTSPVLLSDGSILVATRGADAVLLRGNGELRHTQSLPVPEARRPSSAIPTANGGAVLAVANQLLWLDGGGGLVRTARTPDNISVLIESDGGVLALLESGTVEVGKTSGELEFLAELGGRLTGSAAVGSRKLFAVVDGRRLVELDLRSRRVRTLAAEPSAGLGGKLTSFGDAGCALTTDDGLLSLRPGDGRPSLRIPLGGARIDPAARALGEPRLVSDRDGTLALTRPADDALFVRPDGGTTRLEDSACADPFRPTPVPGGLALSCRSGQLILVGD